MALKSTVFRVNLAVADMARHYYGSHALTVARHPSETDERMMLRLLAFALHADEDLQFTRGISTADEPDLWRRDLTGSILLWLELGQPDDRRIRRACGLAREVRIYSYGERVGRRWWSQYGDTLQRFANLGVSHLQPRGEIAIESLVQRAMNLTATIQEDGLWLSDESRTMEVERTAWKTPG